MNVSNINPDFFLPGNSKDNPEDSIGKNHNALLDYLMTKKAELKANSGSSNEALAYIAKTLLPKAAELTGTIATKVEMNQVFLVAIGAGFQTEGYSMNFFGISDYSDEFQDYWNQLMGIVLKFNAENAVESIKQIKLIDNAVRLDLDIPATDKKIMFQALSIARYSGAYWVCQYLNRNSEWNNVYTDGDGNNIGLRSSDGDGPPDWLMADIEGALIGAFFTANPFAALGGGAANSAYKALKDAINEN